MSLIVFACIFGATLLGILLRAVLPERHLHADSKNTISLGIGVLATLAALALGVLIASAKGTYDTVNTELKGVSIAA